MSPAQALAALCFLVAVFQWVVAIFHMGETPLSLGAFGMACFLAGVMLWRIKPSRAPVKVKPALTEDEVTRQMVRTNVTTISIWAAFSATVLIYSGWRKIEEGFEWLLDVFRGMW